MIIDCIADLHGEFPELEGGDLLIIAGDLTSSDSEQAMKNFEEWLFSLWKKYTKVVFIAGNHDMQFFNKTYQLPLFASEPMGKIVYLEDSGTEFEDLDIWGCPWTPYFEGVNSHCTAFMLSEFELCEKYKLIPQDTDILITHGPPFGILDNVYDPDTGITFNVGSPTLAMKVMDIHPKYHIFGHIHSGYGTLDSEHETYVNCAYMDENYEPVNKPIRIES